MTATKKGSRYINRHEQENGLGNEQGHKHVHGHNQGLEHVPGHKHGLNLGYKHGHGHGLNLGYKHRLNLQLGFSFLLFLVVFYLPPVVSGLNFTIGMFLPWSGGWDLGDSMGGTRFAD